MTTPTGSYGYSYSPTTGTLSTITAPGGNTLSYSYDGSLPLSVSWNGDVSGSIGVAYDNNFWITQQTINGGDPVGFAYDADGLLTGAGALGITRDPQNGRITGSTLGSTNSSWGYSALGELASTSYTASGSTLFGTSYTRDDLGRIETLTETTEGVATTRAFAYDSIGRLVQVTRDGVAEASYEYDVNGNRLRTVTPGGVLTGSYDDQDRLTSYGDATYSYSAAGELETKVVGSDTTRYSYDVLGNLRSVTLPNGTAIEYLIDGQSRRIGKKVNGARVQGFLYQDGLNPVAELDASGSVVARFVYGTKGHIPDYMVKAGVTYRIVSDHLGSVRLVVNASTGAVVQRLDYDAFGRVTQDSSPGFQPFGFAGGLTDQQTGLVRFGARDYDAQTGRWTSKDPIRFAGGDANLYRYTKADPINLIDPTGLDPLASCLKDFFSNIFPGLDLDAVQIHNQLPWWTRYAPINVGAITLGNDIYFDGSYDPFSPGGVARIGHELVHVAQWDRAGVVNFTSLYFRSYVANWIGGMNRLNAYYRNIYERPAYEFENYLRDALPSSPCTNTCGQ